MSNNRLAIGILMGTAALIAGGFYLAARLSTPAGVKMSQNASAVVMGKTQERGDVSINQGLVITDFIIKNAGSDSLALYDVTTSCMCTVARVEVGSVVSPDFRMGERSSYVANIPPGDTATVKLIFDPAFHGPNGLGTVTREAMMRTNDPRQPKLVFAMSATVVQ
jgi:hypothetical protein